LQRTEHNLLPKVRTDPSVSQLVQAGIKACKPLVLFLIVLWAPALLIVVARLIAWAGF